jgi:hypothetical protein
MQRDSIQHNPLLNCHCGPHLFLRTHGKKAVLVLSAAGGQVLLFSNLNHTVALLRCTNPCHVEVFARCITRPANSEQEI